MRRMSGLVRVNDDEWYTSSKTATMLAEWLRDKANLPYLHQSSALPTFCRMAQRAKYLKLCVRSVS